MVVSTARLGVSSVRPVASVGNARSSFWACASPNGYWSSFWPALFWRRIKIHQSVVREDSQKVSFPGCSRRTACATFGSEGDTDWIERCWLFVSLRTMTEEKHCDTQLWLTEHYHGWSPIDEVEYREKVEVEGLDQHSATTVSLFDRHWWSGEPRSRSETEHSSLWMNRKKINSVYLAWRHRTSVARAEMSQWGFGLLAPAMFERLSRLLEEAWRRCLVVVDRRSCSWLFGDFERSGRLFAFR